MQAVLAYEASVLRASLASGIDASRLGSMQAVLARLRRKRAEKRQLFHPRSRRSRVPVRRGMSGTLPNRKCHRAPSPHGHREPTPFSRCPRLRAVGELLGVILSRRSRDKEGAFRKPPWNQAAPALPPKSRASAAGYVGNPPKSQMPSRAEPARPSRANTVSSIPTSTSRRLADWGEFVPTESRRRGGFPKALEKHRECARQLRVRDRCEPCWRGSAEAGGKAPAFSPAFPPKSRASAVGRVARLSTSRRAFAVGAYTAIESQHRFLDAPVYEPQASLIGVNSSRRRSRDEEGAFRKPHENPVPTQSRRRGGFPKAPETS